MCYVYSNDCMLSVYLRKVHVGTLPKICSSTTLPLTSHAVQGMQRSA